MNRIPLQALALTMSLSFAALTSGPAAAAQILEVDATEQQQLGIAVQTLEPSDTGSVGEVTLRVTFATDGQRVVKSPLAGIIEQLFVKEGDRVHTGDPLVALRSGDLVDLQRDFLEAQAAEALHAAAWERDRKLREAGSISERRWQESRYAHDSARAAAAGLRGQLQVAGMAPADIEHLQADASISPDLVLRAPMDALVVERDATLGDRVSGDGILLRLGNPDKLVLEGMLSASAARFVKPGARIVQKDGAATAHISWVSSVIDPATQSVRIRADCFDATGLLPGQLTHWEIMPGEHVLLLPANAVVRLENQEVAFVTTSTGFEVRPVEVVQAGSGWRVLSGLSEGESVAVRGTATLKGMALGMGGSD